jgi:ABC-type dipeptide/oligopeptide/nickel transport system ATPase component
MTEGRIVENREVEELFTAPQADYTRHLLQNTPSIERALEENTGSTR